MSTYQKENIGKESSKEYFENLCHLAGAYIESSNHPISALSNVSSVLFDQLADVNWVGFYLFDGQKLVVGPFQGKPACSEIQLGKGVCGQSALQKKTLVVDDVKLFDGHIACDAASASEVVVPVVSRSGRLLGVLDIDSPMKGRFDQNFAASMENIVAKLTGKFDVDFFVQS